ncbi:uncharacterized protein LOC127863952 [Dreissena polymorpha]|uniref:uncharacterized protein LOC127863952 n=1 Tax=Dreissena polymorpha TaxID=45954 RepID=UPI002263CB6E|nr:uncharacterized protein LOC127863952 [Dreissena polymorpha]
MEQKLTNKEAQNWLKCMLATFTTRDVIAKLADVGFKAFYTHVRSGLLAQQGILETTTCNLCSNPSNMCGLCSEIGNQIWDNHRFKKAKLKGPSWSNTDSTKWCIDSWELAKCYMPPTGYKDKPDADSTDFNGIIGAIYNCTWMQCYFTNDLSKDSNICAKAREEVNKLRHIQDTNINDGDMISFFDCLLNLLNDPGHLNSFKPSVDARTYLTQLQQETLPLSENAVNSTMKKIYEDQKEEFRELLIEHYRQTQSTVSVSPICDGRDKPIHTVFVRPTLIHVAIENDGSRRKTDKEVHHYRELFYKENKLNKRVIIQGEPGMGKTTLLSKFVLDWCEAASSESQEYSANFSDLETLQGFKFLFHLNLRDSPKTFEVVKMIKTQLINKMYADEGERTQVYKILQHIMNTEKCILCMDGLNEWTTNNSDPFPLIATCHKQCVALITTRPWKMADKRIKDSGIDLLIEISGIMDKNQLAIFVLKSLQTNNSKSYAEFMLYVEEKKLHQFLASPWLLTLLVSVWINSQHFSGSLCELNCILIDNLFRKATTVEGIFSHAQFRCLKATNFIYPHVEILNSLAKLAFECTFSSGKSLVFSKEKVFDSLSQELLTFSLQAGILSERYISSIKSQFSFLHETVQEFLAAFHIAKSNDISISSILGSIRHVLEISQVFVYLCGLNTEKANTFLDSDVYDLQCDISHGLSSYVKRLYHKNKISVVHDDNTNFLNIVLAKRNNTETNDFDSNARCVSIAILFQSMLIAGFKEAEASDQNVSYLVCNDFIFHEYLHDSELGDLKSMLMNNTLRVRSLILRSNTLQTKEILTVLQMSKACLTRLMIPAHHDLYRAFSDLNITELVLETYIDAPVLSDAIKSLSMLTYLRLTECNLQYVLCVPVSLKHLELYKITCSAVYLSRLLVLLSSLDHSIQLFLCYCSLAFDNHKTNSAYDRANTDKLVVHSELLSCDMSRIDLLVINGSRDLYELLRGTSIGILALSTTDDVSLAADILPTLSKLETLHIRGTFKDRGCVQLPPTLKELELCEVKCSTEWFGSLLIKLASLHHQVKCYLFFAAVNNRYTEDGLVVSMSDEHSELLSCDMSRIDLLVINGSRDLYELLRGTS